ESAGCPPGEQLAPVERRVAQPSAENLAERAVEEQVVDMALRRRAARRLDHLRQVPPGEQDAGEVGRRIIAQREEAEVDSRPQAEILPADRLSGRHGQHVEHIALRSPSMAALWHGKRGRAKIAWPPLTPMWSGVSALRIPNQRAVIDRRALAASIAEAVAERGAAKARPRIVELANAALADGRAELTRRLAEKPSAGHEIVQGHAFLIDQLIRVLHDHVVADLHPARPEDARLTLMAVGGYGRGEMAPHSDVDIAFITAGRDAAWAEQVIETLLYYLWDLALKVGHSSRSVDEMARMAKADLTIRTAILEGRYLWGDQALYEKARERFWSDVVPGSEAQFVREKLAERDARHKRMGDSRYVVEPNVKDGKGGLRDLQTLYWIGKYIHRVRNAAELVDVGLFTQREYGSFRRAEGFLLAVRCHLHMITHRAEDRLTFDIQREVAKRMNFAERPGKSAVERFMQYYFLQAQTVGHLTGV